MSQGRLPVIGSSHSRKTAKPSLSSPAVLPSDRKRSRHQTASSSSSSSRPHPGPSSNLLSDSSMTPWGGPVLYESSFTTIPLPPPPPLPPTPPAPRPTPSTPYRGKQNGDRKGSGVTCEASSSSLHQDSAGEAGRALRSRRDLSHRQVAHLPRLRPLRPVSNLSFSRSFTFSFFELPLHLSPRCRAERVRNLLLLWRQIHL
eukprot:XP_011616620.1 PREDICTED: uncharacterized protein DDB_G0284459-like [Takifugu rubripes]